MSKKRQRKKSKGKDSTSTVSTGSLNNGGFMNALTGAGTSIDKGEYSYFTPTRINNRQELETLYVQSWACAKFIDIPIDDMFLKWRKFVDMDQESIDLMEEAEKEFQITTKLSMAMKSGNLYGTGVCVILTKEAPPDAPLNIDRMRPGDLVNILAFDRFDLTVSIRDHDVTSPNYGMPEFYNIQLKLGGSITVHYSRVLRFDGKRPLSQNGWTVYDQDWGVSDIISVMTEIMSDSNISKGVAHLVNESSIPIIQLEDLADSLSGDGDCDLTIAQRMQANTLARSIYRTQYIDKNDTMTRLEVNFSGLHQIMDRFATRLAASKDIPATRFWGQSPLGLNATGDGDMKNYAIRVDSEKVEKLTDPLYILDQVLAKHKGVNEDIFYEFPSLIDVSDGEQSDVLAKITAALAPLVQYGHISGDEIRKIISNNPIVGTLEDRSAQELEEISAFKRRAEEATQVMGDSNKGFWSKIFKR